MNSAMFNRVAINFYLERRLAIGFSGSMRLQAQTPLCDVFMNVTNEFNTYF